MAHSYPLQRAQLVSDIEEVANSSREDTGDARLVRSGAPDALQTLDENVASDRLGTGNDAQGTGQNVDEQVKERRTRKVKLRRRKRRYAGPNMASHNHDTSANLNTPRPILEALQSAELVILPTACW